MKHMLIITEDIIKIQTLTGFLGGVFKSLYTIWLQLRLQAAIVILKRFFKLSVITASEFQLSQINAYYYGDELAKLDYSANRTQYLAIADRLLKDYPQNLFKNRLAIHLTYDYFVYTQAFQQLFKKIKPDLIVTLSLSYHEQIARYLAKEFKIKALKLHFLTFIWLNHWLKRFFLKRQFNKKLKLFTRQSKIPMPSINKLRSATFLSLDFFRHFKTLAPVYRVLNEKRRHPWLVTDLINVKQVIKNLRLSQANYLYLASFLPAGFSAGKVALPKRLDPIKNLDDFLYNLGLTAAAPMIELGQKLSRFYLAAAQNLFKLVKPKGVVVVSDVRFCELALATKARTTKVLSLLVSPNTILALDKLNSYDITGKVAVVGEYIKNQLMDIGLNPAKISVVGDPQTENYRRLISSLDRKKVYKSLGLSPDQKIALLISFGPSQMIPKSEKEAYVKMSAQAVAATKNTVLVIKPHPSEKRYRVLEELNSWGIANAVVSDNNRLELVELLDACSAVLQTWSMTVFEAIMMDRPVISVNPFKKNYGLFVPIISGGGAVEVFDVSELKKWLTILTDPGKPQTQKQLKLAKIACARFIATSQGKAADKVISLLAD